MPLLGAIIAGGAASRFGSDKGAALLGGRALLDHVAAALTPQVDALVIVGRDWRGLARIDDRPSPGMGPLSALNAALHHGRAHGFDDVLAAGCDVLPLPVDLARRLSPGPAVVAGQWLLGHWPVALADRLDDWLAQQDDRSIRAWMRVSGAREVDVPGDFRNINRPEDLM